MSLNFGGFACQFNFLLRTIDERFNFYLYFYFIDDKGSVFITVCVNPSQRILLCKLFILVETSTKRGYKEKQTRHQHCPFGN